MRDKILIPTILVATVLVAGFFAFSPVDQAGTIHTTILGGTMAVECETTTNTDISDTTEVDITADDEFVLESVFVEFTAGDGTDDIDFPVVEVTAGQGGEANTIVLGDYGIDPAAGSAVFDIVRENDDVTFSGSLHLLAANNVEFEVELDGGAENANESLTITACVLINEDDADSLAVTISD